MEKAHEINPGERSILEILKIIYDRLDLSDKYQMVSNALDSPVPVTKPVVLVSKDFQASTLTYVDKEQPANVSSTIESGIYSSGANDAENSSSITKNYQIIPLSSIMKPASLDLVGQQITTEGYYVGQIYRNDNGTLAETFAGYNQSEYNFIKITSAIYKIILPETFGGPIDIQMEEPPVILVIRNDIIGNQSLQMDFSGHGCFGLG